MILVIDTSFVSEAKFQLHNMQKKKKRRRKKKAAHTCGENLIQLLKYYLKTKHLCASKGTTFICIPASHK